jgi:hypothetical protein
LGLGNNTDSGHRIPLAITATRHTSFGFFQFLFEFTQFFNFFFELSFHV